MSKGLRIIGVFFFATVSGCAAYQVAVPSNQGKAYIIRTEGSTQDMLKCEASSGRPVCTVQSEQ